MSGYSRFPVHEPGNRTAFRGLLLVKTVGLLFFFFFLSWLTFVGYAVVEIRPVASIAYLVVQVVDFAGGVAEY